jgi:hypothetical protein
VGECDCVNVGCGCFIPSSLKLFSSYAWTPAGGAPAIVNRAGLYLASNESVAFIKVISTWN